MNKLYTPLLSHGFTLKKVGETFFLVKDNLAFVQNGQDKVDAYLIIGSRDAKLICSNISKFDRIISLYVGVTGQALTRRTFTVLVNDKQLTFDRVDTSGNYLVLKTDDADIRISKTDFYAILELAEQDSLLQTETTFLKRIFKRFNIG